MDRQARLIKFNGIVQGVGFRPFVFNVAEQLGIKGWVSNSSQGVIIHAEGYNLDLFYRKLLEEAPPLARIIASQSIGQEIKHYESFSIVESNKDQDADVIISPDVATCKECLKDIVDLKNRRYQYPFTNCTNCGPRYTIIRDIPYDRDKTTMAEFPMCEECEEEYQNPRDRRFHAQPTACIYCGPKIQLVTPRGVPLPGIGVDQLIEGKILAVKGLGGFHLVCDARNSQAVRSLRERKERGAKPFALMARDLEIARSVVDINPKEEELLLSAAAPIVILRKSFKNNSFKDILAKDIAPGLNTLGIMLPNTPLHHLLFEGPYDFLVMTSANLSGRPLIYSNDEALETLQGIADYFLIHNREIYHPCDDSVVQVIGEETVFHRRARGYVPLPIVISSTSIKTPLLGVGSDIKNAFCLASGHRVFLSQYLGDMESYENFQRFEQQLKSFQRVVNIVPNAIAYDKHPNYQLTRFALEKTYPKHSAQHHHAHLVSVLGEWGRTEPTLGIICDGTGLGEDQCIWGFEFIFGNSSGYQRKAHLEYLGLPGGDAGAKHPLRIAYAYVKSLLDREDWQATEFLWKSLSKVERRVIDRQLETGIQVFRTSSAGRLFDAVSGLIGVCTTVTYEGQAAIELESVATVFCQEQFIDLNKEIENFDSSYSYEVRDEDYKLILGVKAIFKEIIQDLINSISQGEIAFRFHLTIAKAIVNMALRLGVGSGPLVVSGGVFQNRLLTEAVLLLCQKHGISVLRSRSLPPGDGGIAFGQILIANEVL